MTPSRIEIRLPHNCGDAGLAQIRDVIREKALRPPGSYGPVFIVPTPEGDVTIDTHVRRINASYELVVALQRLKVVDNARLVGEPILNVA